MFPKTLDNANVLFYTPKDNFGCIYFDNGDIFDYVYFLAICKYQDDDVYYLFSCNENYEVVGDSIWNSIEDCMKIASSSYDGNLFWISMK